eukprot:symbB.v1.2.003796.t3/scaffold192.1/size616647/7
MQRCSSITRHRSNPVPLRRPLLRPTEVGRVGGHRAGNRGETRWLCRSLSSVPGPKHPGHDYAASNSDQPGPPPIPPFFVEIFRGMGQVVFCNNSMSGVFIATGLMIGDPQTGVMALLGCTSATGMAYLAGLDRAMIRDGLAGYNGALVGCALTIFQPAVPFLPPALSALPFSSSALADALLTMVLGGLSAPLAAKLGPLMAPVPQWTVVFNVIALAVLGSFAVAKWYTQPPKPVKPAADTSQQRKVVRDLSFLFDHPGMLMADLCEAASSSVAQIFLLPEPMSGLFILAGIGCYSPAAAGLTFAGAFLGNTSALALGHSYEQVIDGLWGYNAALSSLAVGIFFVPTGLPYAGLVVAGATTSILATIGVKTVLDKVDLPCLTVPFCGVASACFLLGGRVPGLVRAQAPHSPEMNLQAYRSRPYEFAPNVNTPTILRQARGPFQELPTKVMADAKGFEDMKAQGTGASVRVEGEVVESPAKGQAVEISCGSAEDSVKVLGTVDGKDYPLAKKKHSIEYLREIAHLRPRTSWTLEEAIEHSKMLKVPDRSLLMKMDIEASEWPVLANTSIETLKKFRQLIIEFHGLDSEDRHAEYVSVMHRLLRDGGFQVVHLHGNNCCPAYEKEGFKIPVVIELTLDALANQLTSCQDPKDLELDKPNNPNGVDDGRCEEKRFELVDKDGRPKHPQANTEAPSFGCPDMEKYFQSKRAASNVYFQAAGGMRCCDLKLGTGEVTAQKGVLVCLHFEGKRLNGKIMESTWTTATTPPCIEAGHTPDFPALGEGVIGMHLGILRLGILVFFEEGTGWPIGIQPSELELDPRRAGGRRELIIPPSMNRKGVEEIMTYTIELITVASNLIGAVSRVRNTLAMSTHQFFQDRGFLYVHTPIITTADCEGAGEMFRIAQGGEAGKEHSEEFFGGKKQVEILQLLRAFKMMPVMPVAAPPFEAIPSLDVRGIAAEDVLEALAQFHQSLSAQLRGMDQKNVRLQEQMQQMHQWLGAHEKDGRGSGQKSKEGKEEKKVRNGKGPGPGPKVLEDADPGSVDFENSEPDALDDVSPELPGSVANTLPKEVFKLREMEITAELVGGASPKTRTKSKSKKSSDGANVAGSLVGSEKSEKKPIDLPPEKVHIRSIESSEASSDSEVDCPLRPEVSEASASESELEERESMWLKLSFCQVNSDDEACQGISPCLAVDLALLTGAILVLVSWGGILRYADTTKLVARSAQDLASYCKNAELDESWKIWSCKDALLTIVLWILLQLARFGPMFYKIYTSEDEDLAVGSWEGILPHRSMMVTHALVTGVLLLASFWQVRTSRATWPQTNSTTKL